MEVLGLILSLIFYLSLLALIFMAMFYYFKKKYYFSNSLISISFLHSLVVVMVLSWALILMNGGYDVNFYLDVDYTWIILLFIPLLVLFVYVDKNLITKYNTTDSIFHKVCRFMLPVLMTLTVSIATILLYFNCNYFCYLKM